MRDISLYEIIPPERNNFTLKFRLYENHGSLMPHWHEHTELLFFLSGSCNFLADGKSFPVKAGDLVIINNSEMHSFSANGRVAYYCLLIAPAFFSDVEGESVCFENLVKDSAVVKECFRDINAAYTSGEVASDMMQKSHAYRLMAHLMKHHRAEEKSERERGSRDRSLSLIEKINGYVSKNLTKRITTGELARVCFFTEEYFCRFFKRTTGMSPLNYVNELRISKAEVLLAETDEPIGKIATRVGFDDVNYFSRVFKRIKKCSPSEYRGGLKNERDT